jgi:DNA repair photolyase
MEKKLKLMRTCLTTLTKADCRIQIITKSTLVVRDLDLLKKLKVCVSFSLTTLDKSLASKLEPKAPSPQSRLKAVSALVKAGIPVTVRVDPIIPFLNDETEQLIKKLSLLGVKHITCSTYKVKPDNWKRFSNTFPEVAKKLKALYLEGRFIQGYRYLPEKLRYELMQKVKEHTEENDMTFGSCREGFARLNSAPCDGSTYVESL